MGGAFEQLTVAKWGIREFIIAMCVSWTEVGD